ncbi:hypothetical protein D5086_014093 [Populus alba]|uniref:Uncharacterized protein n=1 Tax=Populus alba TaxID=43335 RepID=A0ACC4C7P5_POPAL
MHAEEIHESSTTAVCPALIFINMPVGVGTFVNMHMGFLSVGSTQLNIKLGFAKMAQAATDKSAFLPTRLRSSDPSSVMDIATALTLLPGSPSSVTAM